MERDMLGICLLGFYYLWAAFDFVLFLFQFFYMMPTPKKRGFPLFFVVFICSNAVLFIVIVYTCVFVWFAVPP